MREKEKRELINYHKNDLIIILLTHHIFVDVMASKIYIFQRDYIKKTSMQRSFMFADHLWNIW